MFDDKAMPFLQSIAGNIKEFGISNWGIGMLAC
jgi:hypothetical protein